jgi:hypothetical protein
VSLRWLLIILSILGILMGVLFGTGMNKTGFLPNGTSQRQVITPDINGPVIRYYGYGDSMSSGDDMYVVQMQKKYDPGAISSHNTDGSGKTSCGGLQTIGEHYSRNITYFIYMFTNDQFHISSPEATAYCYMGIYEYVTMNGTVAVPVIGPLRAVDIPEQLNHTRTLQDYLDVTGIPYVKMYDALDSIPGNGVVDGFVPGHYEDGTHPTHEAHGLMADYLWTHPPRLKD